MVLVKIVAAKLNREKQKGKKVVTLNASEKSSFETVHS